MDEGGEAHFCEHVELIIGGRAIGTKADGDAGFSHLDDGCDAGGELQVAARIMCDADVLFLHDGDVFIGHMDAVGCECRQLEETEVIHEGDRCLAVFLEAVFYLPFCFGEMDVDRDAALHRFVAHLPNVVRRAGVGSVRSEHDMEASVSGAFPFLEELDILLKAALCIRADACEAASQISADTGFVSSLRAGVHEHVHVAEGGGAAADHFCESKHASPVDDVVVEVVFSRPDLVLQPVHQFHIVGVGAEQCHRNVGVGIHKPGHGQHAFPIDDFLIVFGFWVFREIFDIFPV